jgi:hypothetical protein
LIRSDLIGLRLPDVVSEFRRRLRDVGQRGEQRCVEFARVGLRADAEYLREPHLAGDRLVQAVHLIGLTVEQDEEGCLGARGTSGTAEAQLLEPELDSLQVE